MATSTFDLTNAAICKGGFWGYGYLYGADCLTPWPLNSFLSFKATGTDCSITYAVLATGTNYFKVSIDGGALATIAVPGSAHAYTLINLFTGLSDAAHDVVLLHTTGFASECSFQVTGGLSVTGSAPAIALSSGYGPTYSLCNSEIFQWGFVEGDMQVGAAGVGISSVFFAVYDGCIRFKGNPTSLKLFGASGGKVAVWVDGVRQSTVSLTAPTGASEGFSTVISGLDGATHEFVFSAISTTTYMFQVMFVGGDIEKVSPSAWRPLILWIGDSITVAAGTADTSLAFAMPVSMAKGYGCMNIGVGGIGVLQYSTGGGAGESIEDKSTGFRLQAQAGARDYAYVVYNGGHNNIGTATAAAIQASYVRQFTQLKSQFPNQTLYALGVLPTNTTGTPSRASINTAMQAAVTAVGGWTYISTDLLWGTGGLPPTTAQITANTVDGIHPNAAGYVALKSLLLPNFATYSPSSGGGASLSRIFTGF